jgi:hypothetical protein
MQPPQANGRHDGRIGIYNALLRETRMDTSWSCKSFAKLTSTLASLAGVAR